MDKEYKFYPSYASIRKYEQGDKACPVDKFFLLAIVLDLDTEKLKEDIARFLAEQPKQPRSVAAKKLISNVIFKQQKQTGGDEYI